MATNKYYLIITVTYLIGISYVLQHLFYEVFGFSIDVSDVSSYWVVFSDWKFGGFAVYGARAREHQLITFELFHNLGIPKN